MKKETLLYIAYLTVLYSVFELDLSYVSSFALFTGSNLEIATLIGMGAISISVLSVSAMVAFPGIRYSIPFSLFSLSTVLVGIATILYIHMCMVGKF